MDAQESPDVRRGSAQFLHNKAIIYLAFTALYVVFVVTTTVLFVIRTRSARYRATKLMVIQTFGTLSLSIVSGLSNALHPYWPCFISLWGLYLGITLWLFGFVARTLRLLFQSEIHQAKLHVTALHPDSEAYLQASGSGGGGFGAQYGECYAAPPAAGLPSYPLSASGPRAAMDLSRPHRKADWDQVLERNELKSTPMVQKRYPFGRMLDNISWARKSWWFSERILIRVFIGLVLIVVAYLVTVQSISPTMRIDPVSTRCNSKWEYILMYILMSLHVLVFCPLMTYWLRGMHDAYGLRRDLVIEVMVAAISYVLFLVATSVFGMYDIYFSSTMFLFIGSGIVHFIGVVIPLWKTYKQSAPDTLPDDYDMYDDSEDQDSLNEPKERPQSEDINLARSIKRFSYGYPSLTNGTAGPSTPIRKLQGPPSADPTKPLPDHIGNSLGPTSGGGSFGRTAAGRIGAPTSQSRWNSFVILLQSPAKFEQFKYYAAACFCTELTLFLEDYQQLKSRVYPCYKPHERRSRPATPPSPIDPSLPADFGSFPPNVARRRSVQTQSPKVAATMVPMNEGTNVGKPHAPVEWPEGSKRPTLRVFTDQGGEPLPDKGHILSCSPHSTTFSPALTDQLHDEIPSGAHITIYDTIGPIYRPLKLAYNPGQDQFLPQRMTLVKHPPVPQHLKSLFYSFYNRYIDPNSVLAINMPGPYVKEVANNIRDQSYTITMFDTAHHEVMNMLYDNVYPRYLKMRRASRIRSKV
ncbi:hypothetical protein H4R34_000974 [Dimargaris verticillata]|uniref:RGS domain-containing protein n=1 Tax=Dimargaris verticillata TaxID=2761393 RepID=A0A9W8EE75_9FUNG|nr:hypothetical protein H4R34_000974 [Dimargaris verticillata]